MMRPAGGPSRFGVLCLLVAACSSPAPAPDTPARRIGDDTNLPGPANILFWPPEQQLVGYRNIDKIFSTRLIPAGDNPYPLPERPVDLTTLSYEVEGETFDLAGFLDHNHIAGLLAIKSGEIVLEYYGHGNTSSSSHTARGLKRPDESFRCIAPPSSLP